MRVPTIRAWQTNAVLILIGAAMFVFSHQLVVEYHHFSIGFSGVSGWSAILYIAATWLILTQPVDRLTFPIILIVAIACRFIPLFAEPYLSSDIYRYVWDGIVQHAHINPYRYIPGDPHLAFLREPHRQIFDYINRRDVAPTIYPPAAQLLFYLVTLISPTVIFMKTVMVLFEGVTMYALVALLKHLGLRREQSLLYAWCPLLIWEIAGAGHLDSAAMAFIALALLARYRKQDTATGLFLAIAVLLKFYPIVLFPALYRRNDWKMPAIFTAAIAMGYAAYSSVGLGVFGYFGGYVQEEGIATGTRYFLLDLVRHIPVLHNLPTTAFVIFAAFVFMAITIWAWNRNAVSAPTSAFLAPAFVLATALMFLFSPHYAWYIIWLIPFFTLMPNLPILVYLMGFFYLFTTPLAVPGPKMYRLNEILYIAVLASFILYLAWHRWRIQSNRASHPL